MSDTVEQEQKTFYSVTGSLNQFPFSYMEAQNGICYSVSMASSSGEYYVVVYKMSDKQDSTKPMEIIGELTVIVSIESKPIKLCVSESGLFALLSFSDDKLSEGQLVAIWLTQKRIQAKQLQFNQVVTSMCFQKLYQKFQGCYNPQIEESVGTTSPEFLLGCANSEVFAWQLIEQMLSNSLAIENQGKLSLKLNKVVDFTSDQRNKTPDLVPSYVGKIKQIQFYQDIDAQCVKYISCFNISAQIVRSQLVEEIEKEKPEVFEFMKNNSNIIIVIAAVGASISIYIQDSISLKLIQLNNLTIAKKINDPESQGIIPKPDELPLCQVAQLTETGDGLSLTWLSQTNMQQIPYLQRIMFSPKDIFESYFTELCKHFLKENFDQENWLETVPNYLATLIKKNLFSTKFNLTNINGVNLREKRAIDIQSNSKEYKQPILGVIPTLYHVLVVFPKKIVVVSLITGNALFQIENKFMDSYSSIIQMEIFKSRIENLKLIQNVQFCHPLSHYNNSFDSSQFKNPDFKLPQHCSLIQQNKFFVSESYSQLTNLCQLKSDNETSNIWQYYLDVGQYETALKHAEQLKNSTAISIVRSAYANDCLKNDKPLQAAKQYFYSNEHFSTVFYKLFGQKHFTTVAAYLNMKIDQELRMSLPSAETNECKLRIKARKALVMMYIESLAQNIVFLQQKLKTQAQDSTQKIELEGKISFQIEELENFILDSQAASTGYRVQPYIIQKVLCSTLENSGLSAQYAKYLEKTAEMSKTYDGDYENDQAQSPEYSLRLYLSKHDYDRASQLLMNYRDDKTITLYMSLLVRDRPDLAIEPIKKGLMRKRLNMNSIIPILLNHLKSKNYQQEILEFCDWLIELESSNRPSYIQSFIYQALAACGQEEKLIKLIEQMRSDNENTPVIEALQVARMYRMMELEALCLKYSKQEVQAFEILMSIHSAINIADIDQKAEKINFGSHIMQIKDDIEAYACNLPDDQQRNMLQKEMNWLINIKIQTDSNTLKQIRMRTLDLLFGLVVSKPCLSLIDAIQLIPSSFTLNETNQLTKKLFGHVKDGIDRYKTEYEESQERIKSQRVNSASGEVFVLRPTGEHKCTICQMSTDVEGRHKISNTAGMVSYFPCGHQAHLGCLIQQLTYREIALKAINKIQTADRLNVRLLGEAFHELNQKGLVQCVLCDETAMFEAEVLLE